MAKTIMAMDRRIALLENDISRYKKMIAKHVCDFGCQRDGCEKDKWKKQLISRERKLKELRETKAEMEVEVEGLPMLGAGIIYIDGKFAGHVTGVKINMGEFAVFGTGKERKKYAKKI